VTSSFPFDAVLFDLDGTLVATDRFWPDAARAGALRAFEELGLERAIPSQLEWMDMVGKPLEEGFDQLFADLDPGPRAHLLGRCVEAEQALLDEGRAGFLPGVEASLEHLRAAGVRTGIASNCGQSYLDAMMGGLGLARWIDEGRCLDSPGIHDKAQMIEDLLLTFDTRRVVMVGDRAGDRDAAWANGVPHVHLARGYAAVGERVEAEATIEGLDALIPRLESRRGWVQDLAGGLELRPDLPLGVSGAPGAGKTLLAAELGEVLDLGPSQIVAGEGLWLPEVRAGFGQVLYLDAPREVLERRLEGRDARLGGPDLRAAVHERLDRHGALVASRPPTGPGIRRIDASNPLGPLI
jgi:phosphoglycolate phosphatase